MEDKVYHSTEFSFDAERTAEDLLNFVNCFSHDDATFAKTIARGHRTLQQNVMRLFIRTIQEMAEVVPDGRNEQTVKLAKRIAEIAKDYPLPLV